MGRRRTPDDYNQATAEDSWVRRAHGEEGWKQLNDEACGRDKAKWREALDQGVMWVLDSDEPLV
jgi:hypothetical protein